MADDQRSASVFVNCPFDTEYQPLFDALVFTVSYCTFDARSALELVDSGEPRLTRIIKLIGSSRFSIHDVSLKVHGNRRESIGSSVRDFLAPHAKAAVPGARAILEALGDFDAALPEMVAEVKEDVAALTYVDRLRHIALFIARTLV